ncbi:Lsr2 family protein [Nocardia implantans]|uniref:Lsr2 family protein n=1 Tax=Nocardia implantans TaxID=3108168 RepID=A0ABU6B2Y4_9NOCA|nr:MULTISPECIES: Lsr2 family protein [unclassified Nocardia]MBF6195803.1 Lsr2 family protein [Nocardia beijingensis]MEA3531683.1 Lsr2 family protein [Nocardia sp. CDC192]MEB3513848.1 Lsr2 family protein [Nocardia sp. CDC186]
MARKVVVTLVDDYDGKSQAEETVSFAVDGVAYEMDLSAENAGQLRGFFEQWVPYARKIGRARRGGRGGALRSATDREQATVIREWARKNGIDVSARGRISAEVVEAYKKANG